MKLRIGGAAIAATALAAISTIGLAAPASALPTCGGAVCVFNGAGYTGGHDYWNVADTNFSGDHFHDGASENDAITSINAYADSGSIWCTDSWWGGSSTGVSASGEIYQLSSTTNNKISSFHWAL
jgi:hypothetical protein